MTTAASALERSRPAKSESIHDSLFGVCKAKLVGTVSEILLLYSKKDPQSNRSFQFWRSVKITMEQRAGGALRKCFAYAPSAR